MMPATMTSAGSAVEFERHREALDHVGAVAGDGSLRDRDDRALARAGVIFGDDDDQAGDDKADDAADEQVDARHRLARHRSDLAPANDELRRDGEADDREKAGGDQALVERAHDRIVGAELDEIRAGDRGEDAGAANRQGIEHRRGEVRRPGEEDRGEHHRRHHCHHIGLEEVRRHAGAVADIVADVVGDRRRVARIVLGNARFDLADEVGADVGALGEDAAAETGEDRNQRGAEAERDQRVDDDAIRDRVAERPGENPEIAGDADQREAGDQHARHRARVEGDFEAGAERFGRRLRGAHVGAHRDVHADEAGRAGKDRADEKADRHLPGEEQPEPDEDDDSDPGDGGVLPLEIGLRALADRGGNLLHALRAGVGRHHSADGVAAVNQRQQTA